MPKQYLDDSGNPIAAPAAKTYLDDSGNPIGRPAPKAPPHPTDQFQAGGPIRPDTPIQNWLGDAESDLKEGGGRTVVGRILGRLQGNSGKYTGLQAGVSKSAADIMGSPELGAVETAKGVASMKDHPVRGAVDAAKGVMHMAEIPGMVMGGPAADAAGAEVFPVIFKDAIEKLPTGSRGIKRLNDAMEAAKDLPVKLSRTHDELMRAAQLSDNGRQMPFPVKKLLKRYAAGRPISYEDARDFYSSMSELSAKDSMAMSRTMKAQTVKIIQALKDDIGDTAKQVGKAAEYYGGMKDYAKAMKAARIKNAIVDALKSKTLKWAVGTGAGYAAAKAIGKEF